VIPKLLLNKDSSSAKADSEWRNHCVFILEKILSQLPESSEEISLIVLIIIKPDDSRLIVYVISTYCSIDAFQ